MSSPKDEVSRTLPNTGVLGNYLQFFTTFLIIKVAMVKQLMTMVLIVSMAIT